MHEPTELIKHEQLVWMQTLRGVASASAQTAGERTTT